jgi:hypothetical protein
MRFSKSRWVLANFQLLLSCTAGEAAWAKHAPKLWKYCAFLLATFFENRSLTTGIEVELD